MLDVPSRSDARRIAEAWCQEKGNGWSLGGQLGSGGTAPVFEVKSPEGPRALKIYDSKFSAGKLGEIEEARLEQQLGLQGHDCQSLVQVYEGGRIQDRLYLMMSRAPGTELEKHLRDVPRDKIRSIVDQIARACLFLRGRQLCHRDIKAANIFISEDFGLSTLLDISVIRNIHDPVGVGSDHDGQLPVLATARYSPPEYLFRLIDPSEELWHALTIYQLGALLHDLIMQTPLFQEQYEQSATNRYRFAWIIATSIPTVRIADVDEDLLFLARRALDKDWKRRSELQIEDFLDGSAHRRTRAFRMLGLGAADGELLPATTLPARIEHVAVGLEEHLTTYFRDQGMRTTHEVLPGSDGDASRSLKVSWEAQAAGVPTTITFQLALRLLDSPPDACFSGRATLSTITAGNARQEAALLLPDIPDDDCCETALAGQAEEAFATLAIRISGATRIVP